MPRPWPRTSTATQKKTPHAERRHPLRERRPRHRRVPREAEGGVRLRPRREDRRGVPRGRARADVRDGLVGRRVLQGRRDADAQDGQRADLRRSRPVQLPLRAEGGRGERRAREARLRAREGAGDAQVKLPNRGLMCQTDLTLFVHTRVGAMIVVNILSQGAEML